MIFSAIALTAFSFAGMANEVKEKEVDNKTLIQSEKIVKKDCFLVVDALMTFIELQIGLMDQEVSAAVCDNLMATCEKNNQ